MNEIAVQADKVEGFESLAGPLLQARALPEDRDAQQGRTSGPLLAAVQTIGMSSPALQGLFAAAAENGHALSVTFPAPVLEGLRNGTMTLVNSSSGALPIARDASGQIAGIARVTGVGAGMGGTVALGAAATAVLPIAIAAAAAYAQQQRLERSLERIEAAIGRVETRLEDADHGVCDAAESFVDLAVETLGQSPELPPYLKTELAAHRVAVESVYASRRRYVQRFKTELERQQTEREGRTGERQPWVDVVLDRVKDGKLESELVLYVRALISRSKLVALVALCLAGDGHSQPALHLMADAERELRIQFFDLHNRLTPLARVAPPERSIRERLPFQGRDLAGAQSTIKRLVEDLNTHVLPTVPEPEGRALTATLTPVEVRSINAQLSAA